MKKAISVTGIKLAILGTALTATAAAFAAEPNTHRPFHDRAGHHTAHHGCHGAHKAHGFHHGGKGVHAKRAHFRQAGLIVPGYGMVSRDFVDGMGLSAEQQKLIEEARKASRDLRETRKKELKSHRQARAERFQADTLDPAQALKQADQRRSEWQAQRRQIDQKWLAVWNSLDTSQQARISSHLKDRAEKAQKRAEKFEERKKQREAARAQQRRDKPAA